MNAGFIERVNAYLDREIDEADLHILREELKNDSEKRAQFRHYRAMFIASEAALHGMATIEEEGAVVPFAPPAERRPSWRRMLAYPAVGAAAAVLLLGVFLLEPATRYLDRQESSAPEGANLAASEQANPATRTISTANRRSIPAIAPLITSFGPSLASQDIDENAVPVEGFVPNALYPWSTVRERPALIRLHEEDENAPVEGLEIPVIATPGEGAPWSQSRNWSSSLIHEQMKSFPVYKSSLIRDE